MIISIKIEICWCNRFSGRPIMGVYIYIYTIESPHDYPIITG